MLERAEAARTRVLVIENDVAEALELERQLVAAGIQVVGTISGAEMAVVETRRRNADVVLIGARLAGHMEGIEAARAIGSELHLPVVMMTGITLEPVVAGSEKVPRCRVTVDKPLQIADAAESIRTICSRRDLAQLRRPAANSPAPAGTASHGGFAEGLRAGSAAAIFGNDATESRIRSAR
jgi:DNA-binding NtrC family response regulator